MMGEVIILVRLAGADARRRSARPAPDREVVDQDVGLGGDPPARQAPPWGRCSKWGPAGHSAEPESGVGTGWLAWAVALREARITENLDILKFLVPGWGPKLKKAGPTIPDVPVGQSEMPPGPVLYRMVRYDLARDPARVTIRGPGAIRAR